MTTNSSGAVTPYGFIDFETARDGDADICLMAFGTTGKLVSPERETVGECNFFVYRRKHNRPWMCAEDIFSEMDLLSRKAYDIVQALAEYDEYVLEDCFNHTCLRRASSYLSPHLCSHWLNIFAARMRPDDGVALGVECDGTDGRPVSSFA